MSSTTYSVQTRTLLVLRHQMATSTGWSKTLAVHLPARRIVPGRSLSWHLLARSFDATTKARGDQIRTASTGVQRSASIQVIRVSLPSDSTASIREDLR